MAFTRTDPRGVQPRRRLPPLNSLKAFEAAARHQNIARAGGELSVTPGAVSRHIMKLEEFLDTKLFERGPQRMRLTPAGEAYAAEVKALFDELQAATAKRFEKPGEQILKIAVLPTFAMHFLVPRLARFTQRFPDMRIEVDTTRLIPGNPNTSDVDVAVWWGTGGWPELSCELLFPEVLIPVASPNLIADRRLRDPDDLDQFLLLHARHRSDDWTRWLSATGATKVDGSRGLQLEYAGLVWQGAVEGLGLAIGQPMFLSSQLDHGLLVQLFDKPLQTERGYYLVCCKGKNTQPNITKFADWLQEEISASIESLNNQNLRCY